MNRLGNDSCRLKFSDWTQKDWILTFAEMTGLIQDHHMKNRKREEKNMDSQTNETLRVSRRE